MRSGVLWVFADCSNFLQELIDVHIKAIETFELF